MAIYISCPICRTTVSLKKKICKCGEDFGKLKKQGRAVYIVEYRMPNGKRKREVVGSSIEKARDIEGKRRVQKREKRYFELEYEEDITISELIEWFLEFPNLKDVTRKRQTLAHVKRLMGEMFIEDIKAEDLESFKLERKKEGWKSPRS